MNIGPGEPYEVTVAGSPGTAERYWLHLLLLLIALATTTFAGAALAWGFDQNRPLDAADFVPAFSPPFPLLAGLPYSLTLLTILLAHEMGHYLACRSYGIAASLPYFIGVPTIIGTFGAFIRIRSPIPAKRQLFDIGIAGPLAGFAFVIPAMAIGLAWSKVIPGIAVSGDVVFGTPLLLQGLEALIFPGIPASDIYLHPVARAAWVGTLATALNLMPIGQLDGGHIVYAVRSSWHKRLTYLFIVCLIPCGLLFSYSWLLWALILFFLVRRHPIIYDSTPLGTGRLQLAALALIVFLISFSLTPIRI